MGLERFVKEKEARERIDAEFEMPNIICSQPIQVPLTIVSEAAIIGTAFDYLLRFFIEKNNPIQKIGKNRWCADISVAIIKRNFGNYYEMASDILSKAKQEYAKYLKTSFIRYGLLYSAVELARLDYTNRVGDIHPDLQTDNTPKTTVDELGALLTIVDKKLFTINEYCILNPTFGEASAFVGGADGDLIIDETLIDIKTIKSPKPEKTHWRQLIGYYLLSLIGGVDYSPHNIKIKKLAIYFSRYGELLTFEPTLKNNNLPQVLKWFEEAIKQHSGYNNNPEFELIEE